MQLNRCRRRSPHGERGNLPIATVPVKYCDYVICRLGVASNESRRSVTAAAQSLQYVLYSIHVCTSKSTRHNVSQLVTVIIECFSSARWVTMMSAKQWRLCPRSWARDVPWNEAVLEYEYLIALLYLQYSSTAEINKVTTSGNWAREEKSKYAQEKKNWIFWLLWPQISDPWYCTYFY